MYSFCFGVSSRSIWSNCLGLGAGARLVDRAKSWGQGLGAEASLGWEPLGHEDLSECRKQRETNLYPRMLFHPTCKGVSPVTHSDGPRPPPCTCLLGDRNREGSLWLSQCLPGANILVDQELEKQRIIVGIVQGYVFFSLYVLLFFIIQNHPWILIFIFFP